MPIIYTLIANLQGTILCQYTRSQGNFQIIGREILVANRRNVKFSFMPIQQYVYYLSNTENQTYMTLCSTSYQKRLAFAYLEEIRKNFQTSYPLAKRQRAIAYSLNVFAKTIEQYTNLYNQPHKIDSLSRMQYKVQQLQAIQRQNVQKLKIRGQKIQVLVQRTQTMASLSMDLRNNATSLKQQMAWKNWKWYLLGGLGLCLFVYLIMVISCDGFGLSGCF